VLRCQNRQLTFAEKTELRQRVGEWLDLQTDLTPFYEQVAGDAILGKVVAQCKGLRLVGIPDLFEALSWAVIGQQITLAYAYTLKQRLVQTFGKQVTVSGAHYLVYPAAETIAAQPPEALSGVLPRWKAEYLRAAAQAVASGQISKEKLVAAGYQKAREMLLGIRGVGNWTANYVLMKCLRYRQAFPAEDAGLHNALRHLASLERKPSVRQVKQFAQSWEGWQAYATFYCWHTLLKPQDQQTHS
jgi:DNA-3-methyladenine glycosylase II